MKAKIRIGCGAGFSGDRTEPAIILAEKGNLDYLVLECLAERTTALAQKEKFKTQPMVTIHYCRAKNRILIAAPEKNKIRLITNMGAANPIEGAKKIMEIANKQNIKVKVAAVTGDDVFEKIDHSTMAIETKEPLENSGDLISANAYLGIEGILRALQTGADVVITGRVADPSLFLAPMVFEFGWNTSDYDLMGKGTVIGHLLECAGQVTGGYYADPVKKPEKV